MTTNRAITNATARAGRYWPVVAAGLILILALALRTFYQVGLSDADSFAYLNGAMRLNRVGLWQYLTSISNIYENRIGVVFPLAGVFAVFGYSTAAIQTVPMLVSLATVLVTIAIGWREDPKIGLLAGLIVATIPQDVGYGTAVMPDAFIPLYLALAMLAFLESRRSKYRLPLLLLVGLLLFLAFQSRATSLLLLGAFLLVALLTRRRDKAALVVPGISLLLLAGLLWLYMLLAAGDGGLQLRWLAADAGNVNYAGTGQFLGHFRNTVLRFNTNFVALYILAFGALAYGVLKRPQTETFDLAAIIFITGYLVLEFASTSLTSYVPIWKLDRFLTILSVPAAIMIACAAVGIFRNGKRAVRLALFGLLALHVLVATLVVIIGGPLETRTIQAYNDRFQGTMHLLAGRDVEQIGVMHWRWSLRGQAYAMLDDETYEFIDLAGRSLDAIPAGSVFIYDPIVATQTIERGNEARDYTEFEHFPEQTPPSWQLLFTYKNDVFNEWPVYVYRVGQ